MFVEASEPITTIPFVKNHEFNYSKLLPAGIRGATWILYILIVIFIVTAVSNGANITDGLDGLATGVSASLEHVSAFLHMQAVTFVLLNI